MGRVAPARDRGGDILRTDWDLLARHYGRNSRVSYGGLRHSNRDGLASLVTSCARASYVWTPAFYADRFRARWMN